MISTTEKTNLKPFNTIISYKEASIGVLLAIVFGYSVYFLVYILDPIIISMFNWSIIKFFSELTLIRISPPNHMYLLSLCFSFVTDIPTCVGWFFGGIIIGNYYKRKNIHFNGVKGSWKSFQITIMAIELTFIISAIYYLVVYLVNPFTISISSFFGSLMLLLLTFFINPGFWLSFSFILFGGIIGSKLSKPIKKPLIVKEKVPKEKLSTSVEPSILKPAIVKSQVFKPTPVIKVEKSEVSVKIPSKPVVTEEKVMLIEAQITEEVLRTGKCPKCNAGLPTERLQIIQKGNDTFCPKCLQVVKAFEIKKKRDKIKEIFRDGVELISVDKEKAKAFFEDALDLAKQIRDDELINEIEEIILKIE